MLHEHEHARLRTGNACATVRSRSHRRPRARAALQTRVRLDAASLRRRDDGKPRAVSRKKRRGAAVLKPRAAAFDVQEVRDQRMPWSENWLLVPLLAATWLVYAPSLTIPFLLDDSRTIRANPLIHDWQGLDALWRSDPARFVGMATFAANYRFGHYDVLGYHVVNLLVHSLTICAVYALARSLLRCPRVGLAAPMPAGARWLPIVAAALFAVHPLHVPAVSYIVQRFASLAALFYVAALWTFVELRLAGSPGRRILWVVLCLATTCLAFLSKQNSATLPLALILVEAVFVASRRHRLTWAGLFALALVVAASVSVALLGGISAAQALTRWAADMGPLSPAGYLATQMRVLWEYVRMFVWPADLHFDPWFATASGFREGGVLLATAGHLAVVTVALRSLRRAPIPAFGVLFYYLAHGVESGVIPLADVIAEHRTYLPNVGLCLAVAWLFTAVLTRRLSSRMVAAGVLVVLFAAGIQTQARNARWQDPIALWRRTTELSPQKARGWSSLARWYLRAGDAEAASIALSRAMTLTMSTGELDTTDLVNAVAALAAKDLLDEALALSDRTLQIEMPERTRSWLLVNRGIVLARLNRPDEAEEALREALRLRPTSLAGLANLANLLANTGRLDEAEALYARVLAIDPQRKDALANLERLRRLRSR